MRIFKNNKIEFFFSELGHFKVVDKNNYFLGTPSDAFLSLKDFSINSLILFKGFLEEKMKEMIHREINEYIVPMSTIKSINPSNKIILLKVEKEALKQTHQNFNAPEESIKFSKLKKLPLYSKSNEKLGRMTDLYYPIDDNCNFIVKGSELVKFLEDLKIIPNRDLLVPEQLISNLSDKIIIDVE